MLNFVSNKMLISEPNVPKWISMDITNMMRRQNKLYKKYKGNGFNTNDKESVDKFREECLLAINTSKQNYLNDVGTKLTFYEMLF